MTIKKQVLDLVETLADTNDLSEYSGLMVHPIVRLLDTGPELHSAAMEALTAIVMQLDKKFEIFVPLVERATSKNKVTHRRYDLLIAQLRNGECHGSFLLMYQLTDYYHVCMNAGHSTLPEEGMSRSRRYYMGGRSIRTTGENTEISTMKNLDVGVGNLRKAWSTARCASKDDWMEWLRRFSLEILKESPSPALRSCWGLAQSYPAVAKYVCAYILEVNASLTKVVILEHRPFFGFLAFGHYDDLKCDLVS